MKMCSWWGLYGAGPVAKLRPWQSEWKREASADLTGVAARYAQYARYFGILQARCAHPAQKLDEGFVGLAHVEVELNAKSPRSLV